MEPSTLERLPSLFAFTISIRLMESKMAQIFACESAKLHARTRAQPRGASLLFDAVRRARSRRLWNLYFRSCRDAEDFCLLL